MTKCVVHIGMHKTGTTSIQSSLNMYSDSKFYYARVGGGANHSGPIFSLFSEHPERHHLNRQRSRSPEVMADYLRVRRHELEYSIASAEERTLIISGEDIGYLQEHELRRLKKTLQAHCEDINILAYVRPPMSFINSAMQQMVRSVGLADLDLNKLYPAYRVKFEKFDKVFGRQSVQLKLYDQRVLVDGDVVKDFCATLGMDLRPESANRVNESSSRETISLLFQYNRYCKDHDIEQISGEKGQRLLTHINKLGESKFRFSPLLLKKIIDRNREDLDWIEERMGRSLVEALTAEEPGDIRSEDDLMATVPGARAVLLECLEECNVAEPDGEVSDAGLMHMLRKAVIGADVPRRAKPPGKPNSISRPEPQKAAGNRPPPRPLLNAEKSLMVLWSQGAAASSVYKWFANLSGFGQELEEYGDKVKLHRAQRYFTSPMYQTAKNADLANFKIIKVIRDPHERVASIFRNVLRTSALREELTAAGMERTLHQGLSFNEFLDFIALVGVDGAVNKVRMQYVPLEEKHPPHFIVNISKQNLLEELNRFEALAGLPETGFASLGCANVQPPQDLQPGLSAEKPEALKVTLKQARAGEIPTIAQLLTPDTKARIEELYQRDFDAYRAFL